MKTRCARGLLRDAALLVCFLAGALGLSQAQTSQPTIASIRLEGTNVVVHARVPAGLRRVTLEGRERFGRGAWEPRAVARLDGSGGSVTFRLAVSRGAEMLRVRAAASDPLPASFYEGTNTFPGQLDSSGGTGGILALDTLAGGVATAESRSGPAPSREVVESDIWKIRGSTLYFFNQYRGLQLIDIADPDAARVRSTFNLPAVGEDLYVLESGEAVLLARGGCYYDTEESQVLVVTEAGGQPAVLARQPVAGSIQESRLVGRALYVASQTYRPVDGGQTGAWEWGTLVSSFDLSNPAAPVRRGTLWHAGYGNVVAATDRLFFVVTQDPETWTRSVVNLIDIASPDGTMRALGSVRPAGRVPDKFKIHVNEGVLTLISEVQSTTNLVTRLETFSLAEPSAPRKLGQLSLGLSERLHATRFEGDRVYVVTFHVQFRMDPLWVVDLSDPARPAVKGELEIPGWSTYLHLMGDRLVALGIETNLTTVSLFDVREAKAPALLSRVALGSGWSWSEANSDEKAFSVLAEAGLILVPFQSWTSNGWSTQVQLIDLAADSLALRGIIEHRVEARRATVAAGRILSVSGREYLSADFADRDRPVVRGALQLAWPVDRVFAQGDHLVEVTTTSGGWWNWTWASLDRPTVRVAPSSDPDRVLTSIELTNLPVLGAVRRGDYLYLAQGPQANYWYAPVVYADSTEPGSKDEAPKTPLSLTVIDLRNLPKLRVAGTVEAAVEDAAWGSSLEAVWPQDDLLVWSGGQEARWWWWRVGWLDAGLSGVQSRFAPWPGFSSLGGQLLAFKLSDPAAPIFLSQVNLAGSNTWSFSRPCIAPGLVYLSRETSEFIPGVVTPQTAPGTTIGIGVPTVEPGPLETGVWMRRFHLDVVDYADPFHPTVRQPVSLPGTLNGVSRSGALLYTIVGGYADAATYSGWSERLDALAYDGVSAHLVTSMTLPATWPHPVLVSGENLFVGRAASDASSANPAQSSLETWRLGDAGKFELLGKVSLTQPASALFAVNDLLAVQSSDYAVGLFDGSDPAALRLVGLGKPPGCLYVDLKYADGAIATDLWLPLGVFGVARVPASP